MKLIYENTLEPVRVGDFCLDFRGNPHTVTGMEEPRHAGSTGRVYTDVGSYFPGVINAKWVEEE